MHNIYTVRLTNMRMLLFNRCPLVNFTALELVFWLALTLMVDYF